MTDIPRVTPSEFARLGQALTDSMCDTMVERLAVTGVNAVEVVDKLNDPDVRDGLVTVLDAVGALHRTGALQTVIDTLFLLHAMRSSANDAIVERIFAFMEHMANNFATEDLATLAHEAKGALEDALDQCSIPGGTGMMGMMKMFLKPETQEAMRFLLSFSCSLRKRAVVLAKSPMP